MNNIEVIYDNGLWDGDLPLNLLDQKYINKYFRLAKEFYPYIKSEMLSAIEMGPALKDHTCQPTCDDCQWYNWAVSFQKRIDEGEFNELNS